jgi:heme A synthase
MTPMTRIRLTLATLVVIAVAATGTLTRALAWSANPVTGLTVAASALVTVACVALALRILTVTERAGPHRRRSRT